MSFFRRVLGRSGEGAAGPTDPEHADPVSGAVDATPGAEPEDEREEELSEDLKSFLYPRDEFRLRQLRYARYAAVPPPNPPRRDPRLARLGALLDRTRGASEADMDAVARAYRKRPRSFDGTLAAVRDAASRAGRDSDLRAARSFRLGVTEGADDAEADSGLDESFVAGVTAGAGAVAVRDLLTGEQLDLLTGPWRTGFGELPEPEDGRPET